MSRQQHQQQQDASSVPPNTTPASPPAPGGSPTPKPAAAAAAAAAATNPRTRPNQPRHLSSPRTRITKNRRRCPNTTTVAANAEADDASSSPQPQQQQQQQQEQQQQPGPQHASSQHNLIEKRYRTRLNRQFALLRRVLPASGAGAGSGFGFGLASASSRTTTTTTAENAAERRWSKAQVLDVAARYIQALEREREQLEGEREGLLEGIRRLREGDSGEGVVMVDDGDEEMEEEGVVGMWREMQRGE